MDQKQAEKKFRLRMDQAMESIQYIQRYIDSFEAEMRLWQTKGLEACLAHDELDPFVYLEKIDAEFRCLIALTGICSNLHGLSMHARQMAPHTIMRVAVQIAYMERLVDTHLKQARPIVTPPPPAPTEPGPPAEGWLERLLKGKRNG